MGILDFLKTVIIAASVPKIEPVKNLEIQHQMLTELERCIACRMCQRYCPDFAIEIEEIDAKAVTTG